MGRVIKRGPRELNDSRKGSFKAYGFIESTRKRALGCASRVFWAGFSGSGFVGSGIKGSGLMHSGSVIFAAVKASALGHPAVCLVAFHRTANAFSNLSRNRQYWCPTSLS